MTTEAALPQPTRRVRWPFLLAAALAIVAALLPHLWPRVHSSDEVLAGDDWPTAAQARPAEQLAASLPVIAGSTENPYDTACGIPTPYCVTSTTLSAQQLATSIEGLLIAHGAHSQLKTACDGLQGLDDCVARLGFRGLEIGVSADDPREVFGMRRPAHAFVVVVSQGVTPPRKPLPAWATLRILPADWGTPRCTARATGDDCFKYEGKLTLGSPVEPAIRAVRLALTSWGLAVDHGNCKLTAPHPWCFVSGTKFRGLGGRDQVMVVLAIRPVSNRTTTVQIFVSS